ncbi:MAG: hypothetical protein QME51_09580, partial [Planctomycetota bacterium]|nr:hypothetical protein [Planctomycetota bacterium]
MKNHNIINRYGTENIRHLKWYKLTVLIVLMVSFATGYGGLMSGNTEDDKSLSGSSTPGTLLQGQVFYSDGTLMTPLSGAEILVNGNKLATSDSDGNFSTVVPTQTTEIFTTSESKWCNMGETKRNKTRTVSLDNRSVRVSVKAFSLIQPEATVDLTQNDTFYFVLQEQSDESVTLTIAGKAFIPSQTFTSSDGQSKLEVTNAQYSRDIRIALTTYLNPNIPPAVKSAVKGVTGEVIAGADIDVRDANNQRKIDPTAANFSGQILPQCSRIIGPLNGEMISGLCDAGRASLYLWYYAPDTTKPGRDLTWQRVGEAEILPATTTGTYIIKPKTNVLLPNLYPFVFTIESPYLLSVHIRGTVKNAQTDAPIRNAAIMSAGVTVLSNEQGNYSISVPRSGNIRQVVLLATATDFIQASEIISVNPEEQLEYTKDFSLQPRPIRQEAYIRGTVLEYLSNAGIPNATVTLKALDVLTERTLSNNGLTVGSDPSVNYKYELKRLNAADWTTVKEGYGLNTLTYAELKAKILEAVTAGQTDITGEYLLRITATHSDGYTETLNGSFMVIVNIDIPPSLGQMEEVTIWGGQTTGYFYVSAPVST